MADPGAQRETFRWAILARISVSHIVGAIFGAPLFGYLVDATGSYAAARHALAGTILLATVGLIVFVKEPKPGYKDGG